MTKRLLLVLVMALSTLGTTATVLPPAANASTTTTAAYANQVETGITKYTNIQRRAHGRGAVAVHSCVDRYAEAWAGHLASTGRFYHRSWRSITSGCHRSYASENIAKYRFGSTGMSADALAKTIVRMWMNSPGHRANLLSSKARLTGVGVRKSGATWYMVQNFAS
jgi:uncharacterized protein YkwD